MNNMLSSLYLVMPTHASGNESTKPCPSPRTCCWTNCSVLSALALELSWIVMYAKAIDLGRNTSLECLGYAAVHREQSFLRLGV